MEQRGKVHTDIPCNLVKVLEFVLRGFMPDKMFCEIRFCMNIWPSPQKTSDNFMISGFVDNAMHRGGASERCKV